MVKRDATTVDGYLADLDDDRREVVESVRQVILTNLPDGYEEVVDFGWLAYVIPLSVFPKTYNKHPLMYAALASQKNYVSLYLLGTYIDPDSERTFVDAFRATGKRLDMGRSCVRFKRAEDLPLDLVGETVAQMTPAEFIQRYEAVQAQRPIKRRSAT